MFEHTEICYWGGPRAPPKQGQNLLHLNGPPQHAELAEVLSCPMLVTIAALLVARVVLLEGTSVVLRLVWFAEPNGFMSVPQR